MLTRKVNPNHFDVGATVNAFRRISLGIPLEIDIFDRFNRSIQRARAVSRAIVQPDIPEDWER
jgi:hypothetical protein